MRRLGATRYKLADRMACKRDEELDVRSSTWGYIPMVGTSSKSREIREYRQSLTPKERQKPEYTLDNPWWSNIIADDNKARITLHNDSHTM